MKKMLISLKEFAKLSCHRQSLIISLFVLGILTVLVPTITFAIDNLPSYKATTTTSFNGTSFSGDPFIISNVSKRSYFVPNNTKVEWDSFLAHAPNGITVSICGDGACTNGENNSNCSSDCPVYSQGFCGDGICQSSNGRVVSGYNPFTLSTGESCSNCAVDCGICAVAGCGVCGKNGQGTSCTDTCSSNGGTCIKVTSTLPYLGSFAGHYPSSWEEIMTLWRYIHGCTSPTSDTEPGCDTYDITYHPELVALDNYTVPSYIGSMGWACSYSGSSSCPAGYFCPTSGKASDTNYICPAGFYCPAGSGLPSFCPAGTYSAAGASSCISCSCEAGTVGGPAVCDGISTGITSFSYNSPLNSTSNSNCVDNQYCGDGYCNSPETAVNCPEDCAVANDARCTGKCVANEARCAGGPGVLRSLGPETSSNDPSECFCGNGVCDGNESSSSCSADCS